MAYERDPSVVSILAGRSKEGAAYRVVRPTGSKSWLLLLTTEGAGQVGGLRVDEDQAILIAPHTPQEYRTAEGSADWGLLWAHFHPRAEWGPLLMLPEEAPGLRRVALGSEAAEVRGALEDARSHAEQGGDPYEEWLAMGALEAALVRIRRASVHADDRGDPRVRAALEFAQRRLREPIGLREMALAAGVSPSRLRALFRAEVGLSPRAHLERRRLDRARQLLSMSDLSIRAVAAEVGFASEFYFANRFRQSVGVSPSAYRKGERPA